MYQYFNFSQSKNGCKIWKKKKKKYDRVGSLDALFYKFHLFKISKNVHNIITEHQ